MLPLSRGRLCKDGASPEDPLFRHEYGHVIQSTIAGPTYFPFIGLPSILGGGLDMIGLNDHDREWYETNANQLAYQYFSKYEKEALDREPWNFDRYPIEYSPNCYWAIGNPLLSPWTFITGLFLQNP